MGTMAGALLFVQAAFAWGQPPAPEELAGYERLLRDHNLPHEGPGLLKFFRDRTLSKEQIAQLAAKVERLSAASYADRTRAAAELVKAGQIAKPFLVELCKNPQADGEAIRRAELCLRRIDDGKDSSLAVAAAHLVAKHKPASAAQALLDYRPFTTDAQVVEALQLALNSVAIKEGKPDPALVPALTDKHSHKRAAAAEALIRGGGLKHKALVEALLADPVPQVRLRVALALVEAQDKSALAGLVQLMGELPVEQAYLVEDVLFRLAGDNAPAISLDARTAPAKVRDAWSDWLKRNEAGLDLARLTQAPPVQGYTLITQMMPGAGAMNGRVFELRPNKEVHFKIEGLRYPLDAQVVGRDRVLIAEYFNNRVTERDFQGKVHWEKQVTMPIACQRLPGGQTFIASRRQLLIVDQGGKEVFTYLAQNITIAAAQRGRDGKLALVSSAGGVQVLDAQGKEVSGFQAGLVYNLGGNLDLLPGGRVLLPLYRENRVVEYDLQGKVVWQANIQYPTSAVRLANGNTLVVSMTNQRIVELDRSGKEIWSHQAGGRTWRARRR